MLLFSADDSAKDRSARSSSSRKRVREDDRDRGRGDRDRDRDRGDRGRKGLYNAPDPEATTKFDETAVQGLLVNTFKPGGGDDNLVTLDSCE